MRSADMIVRDGQAAAEVIQRMRSLFKHEPLAKEDGLHLNGVIDEVCSLMADDVRSNGVQLEMQLADSPLHVSADRVQLQQVLMNLLRNGVEAMSAVTERPRRLTVASMPAGNEVWVLVADQGVGIEDPDAVFESFYSTKPHGLGMGLSVCRSIIDAHGGRLWAERNEPHGSVFGFSLPINSSAAERPPPG
jgi:signal transduction histidine kinase